MTKSTITDERITSVIERLEHFASNLKWTDVRGAQDLLTAADGLRELQERRKADSEPAIIVGDDGGDALAYRRLIQSFSPGTKLYRHAQPAPVVPEDVSGPLAHAYKELTPTFMRNHIAVFERYGIAPNDSSTVIQALRIALDGIERRAAMPQAEPVTTANKLPETQFKQVADLYEMQFDDGRTCAFHTDAEKAVQWLNTCDGNKVQEYVKLERLQEAVSGNSPVIPDGYVMVPKEPTAEMQSAGASAIRIETTAINKLWTGNAVFRAMLAAATQEVKGE
jgi:hypothetical protein